MNLPYKKHLQDKKLSSLTIKNYLSDFRKFARWFQSTYGQEPSADNINQFRLAAYCKFIVENAAISRSSKERNLSSMKVFTRWINGAYRKDLTLASLHRGIDQIKSSTISTPKIQGKPVAPAVSGAPFPISLRVGILTTAVVAVVVGVFFYSAETLASLSQRSPEQDLVGRSENIVYYQDANAFREDYARLKPSSFGFNHDTGEYFIVYQSSESEQLMKY